MKKTLGVFAAVCWLVFGITGVIRWVAGDSGLLTAEMLRTASPEATGLPEEDYPGVCAMTAEYLTGKREKFGYTVQQGTEVFQEHEAAHMADCRGLIRLDTAVCIGFGTAALLLTMAGWIRQEGRKAFQRGILAGICGFAGVAAILGIWAAADFNGLFVTFHRAAFRNDSPDGSADPADAHGVFCEARDPGTSAVCRDAGGYGGRGGIWTQEKR